MSNKPICWKLAPFVMAAFVFLPRTAASSPLIIEVQLPSDKVTLLLWDLLYTQEICSAAAFPISPLSSGLAVLDRVTFPEQPHVVNADSSASVVVRADMFLRDEECLHRPCGSTEFFSVNGRLADPLALELSYTLDLSIDIATNPGHPAGQLCMTLVNLRDIETDLEIPAGLLPTELRAPLEAIECLGFPLRALVGLLGGSSMVTQAGMSASADGSRVAMRFEIDGPAPDSQDSWDRFRAGELAPTDGALDWSIFIDPRVFENLVRNQIAEQLADPSLPFQLTDGPTATWSAGGAFGGGHLHIELSGEIAGGFSETPCLNTIHIDPVEIDVDLRVDANDAGLMKSRMIIDPDPNLDDLLICTLEFPTLDIATIVTHIVVARIAESFYPGAGKLGLEDCTQLDDDEYECADPMDFGAPLDVGGPTIGVLQLTQMIGRSDGAILGGPLQRTVRPPVFGPPPLPPFPQIPKAPLSVGQGLIVEGVQGGCSNLSRGYSGSFPIAGDGILCQPVTIVYDPPAAHANYEAGPVCGDEQEMCPDGRTQCPMDGSHCPDGVYEVIWPGADPRGADYLGNQVVEIRFPATTNPAVIDEFFADPYDLEVLVRSSSGVQYHVIPAPPPPDDALWVQEISQAMLECSAESFGFRLPQQALNMFWLPDPPPLEIDLTATYYVEPPIEDIHRAFLTDLSVSNLNTVTAEPWGRLNPWLSFSTTLRFEGKVHFDFRSMGQIVVPFSLEYENVLVLSDVQQHHQAELIMLGITMLAIQVEQDNLPFGIESADAQFILTPDMVFFSTQLLQVAGPADFDENGEVSSIDWRHMQNALTGPGAPTLGMNTDFDDDADSDLADFRAFQNWFTAQR